jgi:hypothetical protein
VNFQREVDQEAMEKAQLFQCAEACVDGNITATKYQSRTLRGVKLAILIFCNTEPNANYLRRVCSKDRLKIYRVCPDLRIDGDDNDRLVEWDYDRDQGGESQTDITAQAQEEETQRIKRRRL